jgi:gamma-glutamylcyclotransferase (GGCT)/AIG2-like uncharacterized protein YtfP
LQRAADIRHYRAAGEIMNEDLTNRILAALDKLEAGQGSIRDDLIRLEVGQGSIRGELIKTRADIMDRIDRLQNTVTAIQDDIAVNIGAVDAARLANENTRDDLPALREQVSVMWRQLKAVQARVDEIDGRH